MERKSPRQQSRSAAEFIPPARSLSNLQDAAASCTGCDLYQRATQTVFGEGPQTADIIFVGEQPGDQEDVQGHPFVGPAGRMLDKALEEVGITRRQTYVTNAVKHFKWEPQGKRRKHKRPSAAEMAACRPWLAAEVDLIRPKILVCLGATAAQSVLGRTVRIGEERGKFYKTDLAPEIFITIHPSSLLRHPTREQQEEEYRRFVGDLRLVRHKLHEPS
ncbi:MAG TPA: UdgX family uracil-DNA binding protein [Nitrospiraceae bacterium]|nr:UdgX family uracil-DNA binding protein [Nitrospiraceae bacterium]